MQNSPRSAKDITDILAKTEYLEVKIDKVSVSLDSADTVDIQPEGTIFGAKVKVEQNGSVVPFLTVDTKKLKDANKDIFPEKLVDEALEDFLKNEGEVY
jgi:hypothetical protein